MVVTKQVKAAIIGGVFLLISGVVVFLLGYFCTTQDVQIILRNIQSEKRIPGRIYIDDSPNPIATDPETLEITVPLRRGRHKIVAESHGYHTEQKILEHFEKPTNIYLKPYGDELFPLSLVGWQIWNAVTASRGSSDNEVILNSDSVITGGLYNKTVSDALRGRTLVLFFDNTDESLYSEFRMVKVAYNQEDTVLMPVDPSSMLHNEYLPMGNTPSERGIEFLIPEEFDGKLNFVFYQAKLNNLRITAFYR